MRKVLEDNSFYQLKPDQVLDRLDQNGFKTTGHILPLNSLENRVFRVGLEYNQHIVVKCYRPGRWNLEQILEEHEFIHELSRADLPVLPPLKFSDGSTISLLDDGIPYSIWPLNPGRIVEEFTNEELPRVGRLLAQIHNVGSTRVSKSRIHLTIEDYAKPALESILNFAKLPKSLGDQYNKIAIKIFSNFNLLIKDIPLQRIHGDCHKGNLLTSKDGFVFIDFDDFCMGSVVQDFWMLLSFGDESSIRERELFFEGYREFRPISNSYFQLIPALRGIRYIYYSAWILKRWNDPSFPNAFPHFGTEEYWEKEVRDLENLYYGEDSFQQKNSNPQHSRIEAKENSDLEFDANKTELDESDSNDTKKSEITNKDLFWDWEGD